MGTSLKRVGVRPVSTRWPVAAGHPPRDNGKIDTRYNRVGVGYNIYFILCGVYVARVSDKIERLRFKTRGIHSARYLVSRDKNTYIQLISIIGFHYVSRY